MAEDQATHIMYKGRHYIIPGKLTPDEAALRIRNLTGTGPKLQAGVSSQGGFEDTSRDAARILEQYHEPNRARDVLPGLASFAAQGALATVPGALAGKAALLHGLPTATKAAIVAKGVAKAGAYGGVGWAATQGLEAMGVPPGVSEVLVAAAGLGTKPGREMVKAGVKALAGAEATAPVAVAERLPGTYGQHIPAGASAAATEARLAQQVLEQQAAREAAALSAVPPSRAAAVEALTARAQSPGAARAAKQAEAFGFTQRPVVPSAAATAAAESPAALKLEEITANVLEWKVKNKFSGAQIVGSLRNVYGIPQAEGQKMMNMILEANGIPVSPLQAPRIQVGAQKVGRAVGMTKEEVRKQAGPVLGEALGEASPILPKQALQSIIDTMKAMPMAEREAYVARATSGKAQWQIENIRRTLEHLGLLLPAGVVAAKAAEGK